MDTILDDVEVVLFPRDICTGRAGVAGGGRGGCGGLAGRKRRKSDTRFFVVIRPVEPWLETLGRRGSDSG